MLRGHFRPRLRRVFAYKPPYTAVIVTVTQKHQAAIRIGLILAAANKPERRRVAAGW